MTAPPTTFEEIGAWPGVLGRVMSGADLSVVEATLAMNEILDGAAAPTQIAAFITALRTKGETVDELAGMVAAMLARADRVEVEGELVDTCGTGGDRSRSINVSTIAALVVAGAGLKVCKHGNRAASSAAGSADVLEALGVVIDLGPAGVARCIEEVGIGFCFAQRFHPAMRFAGPVRAELGVPTVFNFLGPLANPARARRQVVGVSDPRMARLMLGVLQANGATRAMVVHGANGLDELSTTGPSEALELLDDGRVRTTEVDAGALGLSSATLDDIRGGDAALNAEAVTRVVDGELGPHRDIALLNAAAALMVGAAVADLAEGVELAGAVIDRGSARAALDGLVRVSNAAREADGDAG